jgi:hypothetical protein
MIPSAFMTRLICRLCGVLVLGGFGLCLVQTPSHQAQKLAEAGQAYYTQAYAEGLTQTSSVYLLDMSVRLLAQAVSKDPHRAEYWSSLTAVLRAKGAEQQADIAMRMAHILKTSPARSTPSVGTTPFTVASFSDPALLKTDK